MARWGMVIDLRKCIGCGTCVAVCDKFNNVPPYIKWRTLIDRMPGSKENQPFYLTMSCMHCDKPPCHEVCPTGATFRREDGIVGINYDLCIGCGSCVLACPYNARTIAYRDTFSIHWDEERESTNIVPHDRTGICTKCHFCLDRIDKGLAHGLVPGSDPEATPNCVRFCIADALIFGDLDDPESQVSILIRENKSIRLLEDLKLDAGVYYIVQDVPFLDSEGS